jgi:putative transposase
MSNSYSRMWVHAVWSTKYRMPLISPKLEHKLYTYLSDQLRELGCPVRIVNGMPDHIHCLFLLSRERSVAEVMKQIKGSSSYYINQNNLISVKFAWQRGFASFSVSESGVENVYEYIKNQKQHHKKMTSIDEINEFLRLHGFDNMSEDEH